jgi:hypothetical protein
VIQDDAVHLSSSEEDSQIHREAVHLPRETETEIHRDALDVIQRDAVHSALEEAEEETQIGEETQIHRDAVQHDAVYNALEKDAQIHRDARNVIHRDAVHNTLLEEEETQIYRDAAADVIQHDAVHNICDDDAVVDVWGNPISPHKRLDFYGRRICPSPSPPPAPVKRYRYGSCYIADGRRLHAGGFQVLNWVSGPGISSSSTPSI